MKFLDLFAGIGGFRMGMERAGHECVGYVEWDKYARKSYEAIYDTKGEWARHDITTVTDEEFAELGGKVDIICGGFPCQAFSVAGKREGFNDTRGTLFFDIARAAKQIQPQYLLLENVKGLLNHEKGDTFRTILTSLHELGYDAEWCVLNSKNFGVPQNRERVFIVGHLRGASGREVFPIGGNDGKPVFTLTVQDRHDVMIIDDTQGFDGIRTYKDYSPTIRSQRNGLKVVEHHRIRKLTPRECWRLQGFPDWAFERAEKVNSNSQLYKQAGNSVSINVIYEIAKKL